MEWFPAPPNTSATFLNLKGDLMFAGGEEDGAGGRDGEDRRISQLYSLSAASDEESDCSHRERKERDRAESWTRRNSQSRSPQREEKRGRSRERRDESREKSKEDRKCRRDSDCRRSSSFEENKTRKLSSSSAELEPSRRSSFQFEYSGDPGSTSRHPEKRTRRDSSTRSSFDSGRYENKDRQDVDEAEREKESRRRSEEESRTSDQGQNKTSASAGSHNGQSDGVSKKNVPANLLDLLNQIAQFEKEKGLKPKI